MIPFQLVVFFIYSIAIVLAIYFSAAIAQGGLDSFFKILAAAGTLAWIIFGSRIWWFPLFLGIGFGGVFYFGFKVYSYETGLAIGLLTVLPVLIINRFRRIPNEKLSRFFWFLLVYLAVHCAASCLLYGGTNRSAIGSIGRSYLAALWGLIFVLIYYRRRFSDNIRWCLYAMEAAYLLRTIIGFLSLIWPSFLYLPGLNFILPGSLGANGDDLRSAGNGLFFIALGLFFARGDFLFKMVQGGMFLMALTATLLGGGRTGFVVCLCGAVAAAIYSRKWIPMGGAFIICAIPVLWLNLSPQSLDLFPERMQRTLSILILKSGATVMQEELEANSGTNEWHQRLRAIAWDRWTKSPRPFLIGTGVQAYDYSISKATTQEESFELYLENAANVGAYEGGLWQILATIGIVGYLLYLGLFISLFKRLHSLAEVAARDPFGRVFSFLGVLLPMKWLIFSPLGGSYPTFELVMTYIAVFYLQDKAREQAEENQKPADVIPYANLMREA